MIEYMSPEEYQDSVFTKATEEGWKERDWMKHYAAYVLEQRLKPILPKPSDWNKSLDGKTINVPEQLEPLLKRVGFQMNLFKRDDKNGLQTACDIVYQAQEFFINLHNAKLNPALEQWKPVTYKWGR